MSTVKASATDHISLFLTTHPFFWVEVKVFDLSMLEKTRQPDAVICKVRFFANDHDVVLSPFDIVLHEFFAVARKLRCSNQR